MRWQHCAIALVLAGALIGAAAISLSAPRGLERDPAAVQGTLSEEALSEPRTSFTRMTDDAMQSVSMASSVVLSFSDSPAPLRIQNASEGRYPMQVAIGCNSTAKTIYRSGLIEPGSCIDRAPLDALLEPGTYACTANFFAIDPQTNRVVAQAAAPITLTVLGRSQEAERIEEDIALLSKNSPNL